MRESGLVVQNGHSGTLLALLRTVLRQRPTYLHLDWIHSYYLRANPLKTILTLPLFYLEVLLIYHFTATRLVWTLHNIRPHRPTRLGELSDYTRRFFARHCQFVRVFSSSTAAKAIDYLRLPTDKIRVVPEGSYTSWYAEATASDGKAFLGIPDRRRLLLSVGTLHPYKGIDLLIEAYSTLDDPAWGLVIAGAAPDPGYTQQLARLVAASTARDRIIFRPGLIPDEEMPYYFAAAELAVLPFRQIENSGSVILAMGFGLPIITGNVGVPAVRLRHQSALLYDDTLLDTLQKAMQLPPETLRAIGTVNRTEVERYKWADFAAFFPARRSA